MNKNNYIRFFLAILIPIFFFFVIVLVIPIDDILDAFFSADGFLIVISVIPLAFSVLIAIYRWRYILSIMGYDLSVKECLEIYMAALPLTSITPSKSGDLVRAYFLKSTLPISHTIGSVIVERFFDFLILLLFCYCGMILSRNYEYLFIISIFFSILIVFFIISQISHLIPNFRLIKKISKILQSFRNLSYQKSSYFTLLFFSAIIWLCAILQSLILLSALSIQIPLGVIMANIPIGIFIGMLPISLGGMGTRDAAFIYLFSDYSSISNLVIFGILFTFMRYWLLALIGLPFLKVISKKSQKELI